MMMKRAVSAFTAMTMCISLFSVQAFSEGAEPALLDSTQFTVMDENLVHLGSSFLNDAHVLFDEQDKVPESPENTEVGKAVFDATNKSTNWKPNLQPEYGER